MDSYHNNNMCNFFGPLNSSRWLQSGVKGFKTKKLILVTYLYSSFRLKWKHLKMTSLDAGTPFKRQRQRKMLASLRTKRSDWNKSHYDMGVGVWLSTQQQDKLLDLQYRQDLLHWVLFCAFNNTSNACCTLLKRFRHKELHTGLHPNHPGKKRNWSLAHLTELAEKEGAGVCPWAEVMFWQGKTLNWGSRSIFLTLYNMFSWAEGKK